MLQINTTNPTSVSGGPLHGIYAFTQLHFHWGNNDSVGSEDTINNHT
jgi:carbonic anhydrase